MDETLGLLGSYLIGEVILGAIAWNPDTSIFQLKSGAGGAVTATRDATWVPKIPLANPTKKKVTFLDIVHYVNAPGGPATHC